MARRASIFLFSTYSYLAEWLRRIADVLPHPARVWLYRCFLGKLGRSPLVDQGIYFRYPRRVFIADDVSINRGCEFFPSAQIKTGTITVLDHVAIGPNVRFYAASHDYWTLALDDVAAPIVVDRNVWIGADSIILPGVTIGEGAVIGAGSVVTKDVPPYTVAVGNPARVVKSRDPARITPK